jgi:hypothetical protein
MIVERVVDQLPGASWSYQTGVAQETQLVGDGRLAEAEQLGKLADAQLSTRDGVEDADPRGVAEDFEGIGEGGNELGVEELGAERLSI